VSSQDGMFQLGQHFVQTQETAEWQSVSHIEFLNWTPDGLCANYRPVAGLIKDVIQIQRQTGDHPIVVHCRWLDSILAMYSL